MPSKVFLGEHKGRIEIPLIYDPGTKTEVSFQNRNSLWKRLPESLSSGTDLMSVTQNCWSSMERPGGSDLDLRRGRGP